MGFVDFYLNWLYFNLGNAVVDLVIYNLLQNYLRKKTLFVKGNLKWMFQSGKALSVLGHIGKEFKFQLKE